MEAGGAGGGGVGRLVVHIFGDAEMNRLEGLCGIHNQ
jgi:hypothetical protein